MGTALGKLFVSRSKAAYANFSLFVFTIMLYKNKFEKQTELTESPVLVSDYSSK
jgi:hypothetical protein